MAPPPLEQLRATLRPPLTRSSVPAPSVDLPQLPDDKVVAANDVKSTQMNTEFAQATTERKQERNVHSSGYSLHLGHWDVIAPRPRKEKNAG